MISNLCGVSGMQVMATLDGNNVTLLPYSEFPMDRMACSGGMYILVHKVCQTFKMTNFHFHVNSQFLQKVGRSGCQKKKKKEKKKERESRHKNKEIVYLKQGCPHFRGLKLGIEVL